MSDKGVLFYRNWRFAKVPCGEYELDGFGMTPQEHALRFKPGSGLEKRRLFMLYHGQVFQVWPNDYLNHRTNEML